MKDSRIEEPKFKSQEQKDSAPQRSDSAETFEQARKEKKKKKEKQERRNQERKPHNTTLATRVNTTNILGGHSGGGGGGRSQKDSVQAIYYNYNKKGHFARKCLKPLKPKS